MHKTDTAKARDLAERIADRRDWYEFDPSANCPPASAMLRALAAEVERLRAQVAPATVISGALFDFLGFLTTHDTRWTFSSRDDAAPAVEALREWATKRGLQLDDANVEGWASPAAPAQQTEPAKVQRLTDEEVAELYHEWRDCDGATFADLIRAVESRRAAAWGVNLEPTHD